MKKIKFSSIRTFEFYIYIINHKIDRGEFDNLTE